jgi:hypothetical protein
MSKSHAASSTDSSSVEFGVDLKRDPVFLSSKLKNSEIFSKAMLALGGVVRFSSDFVQKDHSAYQAWVQEQYLREAGPELAKQQRELEAARNKLDDLQQERDRLQGFLNNVFDRMKGYSNARRNYWKWLYDNDRELWYVLDPIVSVQSKSTFFEAFSRDESTYVLVELPHSELVDSSKLQLGTTNIDFGVYLEREFGRVRTYRPLTLTVGKNAVEIATDVSQAVEKKIDLPESWIQGLVQVSAARTLSSTVLDLNPMFVAQLIAKLEAIREKTGPRSLKFVLTPGEPVKVIIEPWGIECVERSNVYQGSEAAEIRIWGRRRLSLLKDLLQFADSAKVFLLGDGMPSFWSIKTGSIETTFGFSGWNALDWSKKMQFSALLPRQDFDENQLDQALQVLIANQGVAAESLVKVMNLKPSQAATILQTLAFHGKAMFLPDENLYVYRELVPGWQPDKKTGTEERKGIELASKVGYFGSINRTFENNESILSGKTEDNFQVLIRRDLDSRISYAQCSCGYFAYNQLRLGPCRHIVAIGLK